MLSHSDSGEHVGEHVLGVTDDFSGSQLAFFFLMNTSEKRVQTCSPPKTCSPWANL